MKIATMVALVVPFYDFLDGVSTPHKPPSNPITSHVQSSRPIGGANIGVDGGNFTSFSKKPDTITELHKLLLDERIKNEDFFQEIFGLKWKS